MTRQHWPHAAVALGGGRWGFPGLAPSSVSFVTCGPLSSLVPPGWSTPITAASGFVGWASWARLEGGVSQRLRCSSRAERLHQVDRGRTWHPGHRNSPDRAELASHQRGTPQSYRGSSCTCPPLFGRWKRRAWRDQQGRPHWLILESSLW